MGKSLAFSVALIAACLVAVCGYRPAAAATAYSISQLNELTNIGFSYGASADRSHIAGRITVGTTSHAFVHSQGVLTDIGVTGGFTNSQGRDVNDLGQAVGFLSNVIRGFNFADRAF